jgi:hypothetical protein
MDGTMDLYFEDGVYYVSEECSVSGTVTRSFDYYSSVRITAARSIMEPENLWAYSGVTFISARPSPSIASRRIRPVCPA